MCPTALSKSLSRSRGLKAIPGRDRPNFLSASRESWANSGSTSGKSQAWFMLQKRAGESGAGSCSLLGRVMLDLAPLLGIPEQTECLLLGRAGLDLSTSSKNYPSSLNEFPGVDVSLRRKGKMSWVRKAMLHSGLGPLPSLSPPVLSEQVSGLHLRHCDQAGLRCHHYVPHLLEYGDHDGRDG